MHKHVYTISLMGKIFGCPVYMDIHICMPQEEHTLLALTLNIKSTGMHGLLLMLEGNLGKKKKNTLSLYIYFAFGLVPCSCLLLDTMHPLSYYTPPLINE